MLIREGDQRPIQVDIKLAAIFAGAAGAMNAAGFQAAGLFSANMTGNVSSLSDYIGLREFGLAGLFLILIAAFVFGAFFSGLIIEAGRKRGIRGIYAYSILFEAGLLLGLALADLSLSNSQFILVTCLSFIMGLQNAATTRISDARVRTTHVSGMATDIGLSLAAIASRASDRDMAKHRLRLHLSTLLSFTLCGIAGAIAYLFVDGLLFALVAAVLLAISLPEARRARRPA